MNPFANWKFSDVRAHNERIANENRSYPKIPNAIAERDPAPALVRTAPREVESLERARVCITGFRVSLLDADNFCGGTKQIIDGLRKAGLISDDSLAAIDLETKQVRVKNFPEEKTVIEIEWL